MEYFLGSVITMALVAIVYSRVRRIKTVPRIGTVVRQSHVYEMIKSSILSLIIPEEPAPTQSSKFLESLVTKVLFVDGKAYWIKDNGFYVANMSDGMIDNESAKIVDIMSMDKVELDKMVFIVDTLTEGDTHDNWNPGNQKF